MAWLSLVSQQSLLRTSWSLLWSSTGCSPFRGVPAPLWTALTLLFRRSLLLSIFCLLLNVFSQRYHKLIQLVQLWCAADLAGTMTDTGQSLTTSHRGHPSSSPLPKPCHLYPICHLPLLLSLHMQEKSIIIHRLKYCELYMEVYFPYIFNEFSCMTPYLQLPQD